MNDENGKDGADDFFGPVISRYTREQAINDGVLVALWDRNPNRPTRRLEKLCREHYKWPIAVTAALWAIIEAALEAPKACNDEEGVVHDILWMSRAFSREVDASTRLFQVIIKGAGRKSVYDLKVVVGPDDDGQPVITIMRAEEDPR